MTLQEIRNKVCKEFDRRNLKSNTRYKALDKIVSNGSRTDQGTGP